MIATIEDDTTEDQIMDPTLNNNQPLALHNQSSTKTTNLIEGVGGQRQRTISLPPPTYPPTSTYQITIP